ncbi:hypothetical protein MFLAVUS_010479 [Mucor flavus]|uniref:SET domain-containing protein n=1 Tax=Mucor flavus TaxID=439312 RepID=A0ABP9ZD00_9FUNG
MIDAIFESRHINHFSVIRVLSRYDDTLASYFVDSLYLWYDTLRMNGDFVGTTTDNNETEKALPTKHLPYFKDFIQGFTPKQVTEFTQHMKRYLFMFRPNAGFEVGSTSRYTGKPEACLLATKEWKAGEQVTCCLGSIAALSEQDDLKLKSEGRDFSVMVSTRKKCSCLFLGPARFMNHDCDSNCEFILIGQNAITFRVQKDIHIGEEMTVFYAEHYFGDNNCECLCSSCEIKKQGHFLTSDENAITDTSDSDITIDENATRRSGRKRKDISYKDYYVPEQVKKSRPDSIQLLRKTITDNITSPLVMQKKQLFCDKDLDPFRPRNDSLDELSVFHDWIDNLSDISDDDEPELVIPKCCPQAKEYCTARVRERPNLCGRCNRHYQIYGLLWPMRKIRKPNGRSKKQKESSKNISLPTQSTLPVRQQLLSPPMPAPLIHSFVRVPSITPIYTMNVTPPTHVQPLIYAEPSIHTRSSIHPVQSNVQYTPNIHYTTTQSAPTVRSTDSSKATKLIMPRPPKPLQPQPTTSTTTFSEPLVISTWPLDKSILKMHTNNLSAKQKKRERALAFKLKRELYPRDKEPYKLVGLDAEIKEKQERLGGLQLENIYLLDLRNRLKKIVSHRCVVVDTSSLPLLEIGRPEQGTDDEHITYDERIPNILDTYTEDDSSVDLVDTEENSVSHKPFLNITKNKHVSVNDQLIDDGTTENVNMAEGITVQHANLVEDTQFKKHKSIEKVPFLEKGIIVKQEPVGPIELPPSPSQNYVFVPHQKQLTLNKPNEDNTYHPLDTSNNAKITANLQVHGLIERGVPNKIVFRGSEETSRFTEHEHVQVKQEPEEVTIEACIQLETTEHFPPPSLSPPPRSRSPSPQQQHQSPMKVSFILQPTNESPRVEQCVYINKPTKLKPRKKSARKGCPIAPPRKEPFESKQSIVRSKFRDAPPPRTIPVIPSSKESTRQCSTNSNIGPFVPIEPNNC